MSERDWIKRYFAPLAASPGAANLTDDTAELAPSAGPLSITTDAMVEGVHFLASDPIGTVARKLVRVNVSDILATGAAPREALLVLGWPQGRPESDLAEFAAALGDELAAWGIALIGGDTVSSPGGLFLSLTLTGVCLGPAPVRRGGAKAGDGIWVTGEIGAARRGFDDRAAGRASSWVEALQAPPLPPREAATMVARLATAAMDVSDGLLGDAARMAEASGLGAEIDLGRVPFAGGAADLPEMIALSTWGDDYQLLLAAPQERAGALQAAAAEHGFKLTRIGRMRTSPGLAVTANNEPVNLPETVAFEHGRIGPSATRP